MPRIPDYDLVTQVVEGDVLLMDNKTNTDSSNNKTKAITPKNMAGSLNLGLKFISAIIKTQALDGTISGGTYVDLNYIPTTATKIRLKGSLSAAGGILFGYHSASGSTVLSAISLMSDGAAGSKIYALRYGTTLYSSNIPCDGTPHVFEITNGYWSIDGQIVSSYSVSTLDTPLSFAAFNRKQSTGAYPSNQNNVVTYGIELYESGNLVRNFVPFINTTNDTCGLYELCSLVPYMADTSYRKYYFPYEYAAPEPGSSSSSSETFPDYWNHSSPTHEWVSYPEAVKQVMAIREKHPGQCFTFAYWSDMHIGSQAKYQNVGKLVAALCKDLPINFAASLGDNTNGGMGSSDTPDLVRDQFRIMREYFRPIPSDKLIILHGNHDGTYGITLAANNTPRLKYIHNSDNGTAFKEYLSRTSDPGTADRAYSYQFSKPFMFEFEHAIASNNLNAVLGEDGTYYYIDYPKDKVRVFALNSFWAADDTEIAKINSEEYGAKRFDRMHYGGYGEAQIKFIRDHLMDLTSEWNVIFLAHTPLDRIGDNENSSQSSEYYKQMYAKDERDILAVRQLLIGCATKTSGSTPAINHLDSTSMYAKYSGNIVTAEPSSSPLYDLNDWGNVSAISYDFTENAPTIVGWFAGHNHQDRNRYLSMTSDGVFKQNPPKNDNTVEIVIPKIRIKGGDNSALVANSAAECAIDIVTVCYDTNQIYMTRLGASSDAPNLDGHIYFGDITNLDSSARNNLQNDPAPTS